MIIKYITLLYYNNNKIKMSCSAKFILIIDKLNQKDKLKINKLTNDKLESNKLNKIIKKDSDNFIKYIFKMDFGD